MKTFKTNIATIVIAFCTLAITASAQADVISIREQLANFEAMLEGSQWRKVRPFDFGELTISDEGTSTVGGVSMGLEAGKSYQIIGASDYGFLTISVSDVLVGTRVPWDPSMGTFTPTETSVYWIEGELRGVCEAGHCSFGIAVFAGH